VHGFDQRNFLEFDVDVVDADIDRVRHQLADDDDQHDVHAHLDDACGLIQDDRGGHGESRDPSHQTSRPEHCPNPCTHLLRRKVPHHQFAHDPPENPADQNCGNEQSTGHCDPLSDDGQKETHEQTQLQFLEVLLAEIVEQSFNSVVVGREPDGRGSVEFSLFAVVRDLETVVHALLHRLADRVALQQSDRDLLRVCVVVVNATLVLVLAGITELVGLPRVAFLHSVQFWQTNYNHTGQNGNYYNFEDFEEVVEGVVRLKLFAPLGQH